MKELSGDSRRHGPTRALCVALVLAWAAALLSASTALAAPPQPLAELWQVPADGAGTGSGAGELDNVHGVAVDPSTGDIVVAESGNHRISEFSPWGSFLRAWGWGVVDGAPELQVCTTETGCRAGLEGEGAGQFGRRGPAAITVDDSGNIYAVDPTNKRIDKFDSAGHFLLAWGEAGTGPGQFFAAEEWPIGPYIAASPAGEIYVGDQNRIQVFDSSGVYQGQIGLPREGEVRGGAPDGIGRPNSIAFDDSGNLYLDLISRSPTEGDRTIEPIFRYDGTSWFNFAEIAAPKGLSAGVGGDVYAIGVYLHRNDGNPSSEHLFVFDGAGTQQLPTEAEAEAYEDANVAGEPIPPFFGEETGFGIDALASSGNSCREPGEEAEDVYVGYGGAGGNVLRAYGPHPNVSLCPPPEAPPSITDQFLASLGPEAASVKARINSHFWPTTTYFVQWGTGKCSEGGCPNQQPLSPGTPLNSESGNPVVTAGVDLTGLAPETTYHYRFVARTRFQGASGEEVEVRGVGGQVGADGAEASFTTTPLGGLVPRTDCPNQSFRAGAAAHLSDCRAYEMVSPVDKAGGDITVLRNSEEWRTGLNQSSTTGDALTYTSYRSFGGAGAAPYVSQYLARRTSEGWKSEAISPPRGRPILPTSFSAESEFKAFSADLCQAWMWLPFEPDPVLDPSAPVGVSNLYRRENCGPQPSYEAVTSVVPPPTPHGEYNVPELQGVSADGRCAIYRAIGALTPDAPTLSGAGESILYERCQRGPLRLVAILPDGTASPTASSAGTASSNQVWQQGLTPTVYHALSSDGTRVYWNAGNDTLLGPSGEHRIYLRVNSDAPPAASGACEASEPNAACSVAVSSGDARFWTASEDGARAIYSEGANLFESQLRIENGRPVIARSLVAHGFEGLMGASDDARRLYFVSSNVLAPGGSAGKPNLYYREANQAPAFVAALSPADLFGADTSRESVAVSPIPVFRAARVSRDGLHLAFASHASLTGYNNTDQVNGEADAEVFVYDAVTGGPPVCVSCNPDGLRPTGRNVSGSGHPVWAAATIPGWESALQESHPLSEDGSHVFFDSFESLLPQDTNDAEDVYEWEPAGGQRACEELGAARYVSASSGCLSLISSGEGSSDSEFVEATSSGRDVFFKTAASLLPQDPGEVDIYDAREGGGFPPTQAHALCIGEACQPASGAPGAVVPGSVNRGSGNPRNPRPSCGRGRRAVKRHGRWRCIRRHALKRHRHHRRSRRDKSKAHRDKQGPGRQGHGHDGRHGK